MFNFKKIYSAQNAEILEADPLDPTRDGNTENFSEMLT